MLTELLLCFLSLGFLCYFISSRSGKKGKYQRPPGPFRWPILGNLPQIAKADPVFGFRAYHKLSQEYGEIMSMRVGLQEMVVLSSYEVMKDLLAKDELSGRLWTGFLEDRSMGKNLGIAFATGEKQQALKTFVLKSLKQFGFGKKESMESSVHLELREMIQRLEKVADVNDGQLVMERFFQLSLLNVLWSMLAGVRYSHDDPKLLKLLEVNSLWFQSGNFGAGIVTAYPFLRFIFKEWTGYYKQQYGNQVIYDFLTDMIKTHRARKDYATNPQSFIDIFLKQIDENRNDEATSCFTDEQFMVTCYDMFQAGFETTSNSLAFGMLFMVLNPRVQEKVQKELDEILPKGTFPTMSDREKLTYTRATVYEVFRMSNILPISGPRFTTGDVYYKNYYIPKGTAVAFNTYSVMRSKTLWGDPDIFRPERFLDSSGNSFNGMEKYMNIAFGVGKRSCLGEVLAQTSVFIYFTTLLQHFKFENGIESNKSNDDEMKPTTEPIFGIILAPHPYKVKVKRR